ncbi:toxin-antitoxin system HicB family antitoxin [Streptacidiphilus sp. PB12-B1b]|uniref:toxin-antitoxin system HicB family antitoxin n=1 Tax=Streptacidiphilus sp. PB12-B1b TaxID=2705012 RepID=UPI0015FAD1CB|nr:toxin-antitoxin system HicB family antitoxin [Streptacidiphilus sp. PB12-B1b]QMU77766.1 toxin-antitoxin system HicB family antitoxin [Streptacidiphilus sp. PB12-B1b]
MDLTPYVDNLRQELAVAADAGGDEARALAERLTAPLESAARLTLLNALSAAMAEVTRELAPGSVDVRLRGLDPEFVVTPPPAQDPAQEPYPEAGQPLPAAARPPVPPAPPAEGEEGGAVRINFRLPGHLKARAEYAAGQEGLSVNAWLVRAVAVALEPAEPPRPAGSARHRGQGYTGWVR